MARHWKCKIRRGWMSFKYILFLSPYGTMVGLGAVLLGGMGAAFGTLVSQGMTNSLHGTAGPLSHLWGAVFAMGGVLKLWGIYGRINVIQITGLWMMLGGYAFYSITVTIGLAAHGMAAGIISGSIAVAIAIRIRGITASGDERIGEQGGE